MEIDPHGPSNIGLEPATFQSKVCPSLYRLNFFDFLKKWIASDTIDNDELSMFVENILSSQSDRETVAPPNFICLSVCPVFTVTVCKILMKRGGNVGTEVQLIVAQVYHKLIHL